LNHKDNCVSQFKIFIKECYRRGPSSIIGIPCGIYVDEVTLRQAWLRVLWCCNATYSSKASTSALSGAATQDHLWSQYQEAQPHHNLW